MDAGQTVHIRPGFGQAAHADFHQMPGGAVDGVGAPVVAVVGHDLRRTAVAVDDLGVVTCGQLGSERRGFVVKAPGARLRGIGLGHGEGVQDIGCGIVAIVVGRVCGEGHLAAVYIDDGVAGDLVLHGHLGGQRQNALEISGRTGQAVGQIGVACIGLVIEAGAAENVVILETRAGVAGHIDGARGIGQAARVVRDPLAAVHGVGPGVDMIVARQDKVHAKLVHQLLKARLDIVLDVRVGNMLGHGFGGLVVLDEQPLVTGVSRHGGLQCAAEGLDVGCGLRYAGGIVGVVEDHE
ncbi:hypothetical protein SDC9_61317 [bioreactor metagenome]|uniref:Uncharacterized protein n=1 Tax=bioreactor metagenome TaxID=1076179 RepID=A0A644XL40_9ZZZZ